MHSGLIDIWSKQGVTNAVQVGYLALGSLEALGVHVSEEEQRKLKTVMNGEISETVLEIILREYMVCNPEITKQWHLSKGLILKDPKKPRSKFLTELDLTLFTPQCVYVFECKSYAGDKRIVGQGTIIRMYGNSCDVYRQNLLHVSTLHSNIEAFSENPIYRMKIFDFSRGQVQDNREPKFQGLLEYTTVGNVLQSIEVDRGAQAVWDMPRLLPAIAAMERASERLRPEHLKYVKELHKHE